MSDLRKAAQLMLDSVEQMLNSGEWYCARERADALRTALAKSEQEPVAKSQMNKLEQEVFDHQVGLFWESLLESLEKDLTTEQLTEAEKYCDSHCTWLDHDKDCKFKMDSNK